MPSAATAPLSFKTERGYYGLRVNPQFEQVLGTIRKPLGIQVPDRKWKWYAMGPYRSFLLDAGMKYHEDEQSKLEFRQSGQALPEDAARIKRSAAGQSPVFDQVHDHGDAMDSKEASDISSQMLQAEQSRHTEHNRRQHLSSTHGPNLGDPTIQAAFDELDEAQVYHSKPAARPTPIKTYYTAPLKQLAAAGQPQAPQFTPFGQLNLGEPHRVRPAKPSRGQSNDYETVRDSIKD